MLPVFDLHCDTPYYIDKQKFNHVIPDKLHSQSYFGVVFAHFVLPKAKFPFVDAVKFLSSTIAYVSQKKKMHIVYSHKELRKAKLNVLLNVEGGHIFDNTFKQIEVFFDIGVRMFTLTWNNSNKLAHSALEADKKGLTKKGKQFCRKLKDFKVIIDLSHASTRTVQDVCEICENQVIASHSCVRTLNPSLARNIDDRAIRAIVEKGGIVGVNFSQHHLGNHSVADHIDYIKDNFGIEFVAIGSDFDGISDAVIRSPAGLKDLKKELEKRGYKKKEIEMIFCGNFLRVFKNSIGG